MGVAEYRELTKFGGRKWNAKQAAAVMEQWTRAAETFVASEGHAGDMASLCGSVGEFMSGADKLCEWMLCNGIDAYPLWDVALAIGYKLDGSPRPSILSNREADGQSDACLARNLHGRI